MSESPLPAKTIVLVDDDLDDHAFFCEALEEVAPHIHCEFFLSGRSAIEAICVNKTVSPDMVFLDINMPELNGLDVAARLAADFKKLPIVVYSTSISDGHRSAFSKLKVTRLEQKANDFSALKKIIAKYLSELQ